MKNIFTLTAAASFAVAIGLVGAGTASADASTAGFGTAQRITDKDVVTSYTVSQPRPSNDDINVPIVGKLYESNATVQAVEGASTPSIPFFNARTSSGDNYRVLWQAYAPEGLSGATLAEGEKASGKIYFDVTGAAPSIVVYNDAVQDRLIWSGSSSMSSSVRSEDDSMGATNSGEEQAPAAADRSCGSDTPIACRG